MLSVPSVAYGLSCALVLFANVCSIPIDNGIVGEPEIECGSETITISFSTQNPYNGKTFVKGFAHDEESCVKNGLGLEQEQFLLRFNRCGVKRTREINGVSVSATVIISFHPIFLTKVDRAYRVSCFFMEATKSVTEEIEVSMLTTGLIEKQTEMPVCRYEILRGDIEGPPVTYARIGDSVYHKWTCEANAEDLYCMRVHSCSVDDGQGGSKVPVLDGNGCEVDHFILQNLEYSSDLMAGQEAHVFKFADRPALYFNCQIELRIKDGVTGCSLVQPNCVGAASPSAVPHSEDETTRSTYESEQSPTTVPHSEDETTRPTYESEQSSTTRPTYESKQSSTTRPTYETKQRPTTRPTYETKQSPSAVPHSEDETTGPTYESKQSSTTRLTYESKQSPSAVPHSEDETTRFTYESKQSSTTAAAAQPTETPWSIDEGTPSAAASTYGEWQPTEEQPSPPPREQQPTGQIPYQQTEEQPSPPPREQQPTGQNPYQPRWRSAQRERRTAAQSDTIAEFDLPEQQIMVFGLEDAPPPSMATDGRETLMSMPINNKESGRMDERTLRTYLSKTEGSVCMSAQRFAGMAMALLGLSVFSIALVLVGLVRRHVLYEALMNKAKQ